MGETLILSLAGERTGTMSRGLLSQSAGGNTQALTL